jgi:putative flippase GtrA
MSAGSERRLLDRSWRYGIVGLFCALANYAIIIAVDWMHGNYVLATTIGFILVVPMGYALQARFTFAEPLSFKSFMRFVAAAASAYPVALGMMVVLCSGFGFGVVVAVPIAAVSIVAWNFAAAHWAILPKFRRSSFDGSTFEA